MLPIQDPTFLLGSKPDETFMYDSVDTAMKAGSKDINLKNPALGIVQDLPPLGMITARIHLEDMALHINDCAGWVIMRYEIKLRGATMMHSNKFKSYAVRVVFSRE